MYSQASTSPDAAADIATAAAGPVSRKPLTPRQERFCHYFVAYANAAHAAREAGFSAKSAKHQGYRLLRTGRVRARIRQLHAELARDHAGDADALIGKLENLYRRATGAGRLHTATRAVELQARLVALKERRRGLPALPPLRLPAQGGAPAMAADRPGPDAGDAELAAVIARAEATLREIDEKERAADGSAPVGSGRPSVGIGSAPGGPDVAGRSRGR